MYTTHILKISITYLQYIKHQSKCCSICSPFAAITKASHCRNCPIAHSVISVRSKQVSLTCCLTSQRILNMNNIATNINSLSSLDPISGVYVLRELLSNSLRKLCSQTAWWSTFFASPCTNYTKFERVVN